MWRIVKPITQRQRNVGGLVWHRGCGLRCVGLVSGGVPGGREMHKLCTTEVFNKRPRGSALSTVLAWVETGREKLSRKRSIPTDTEGGREIGITETCVLGSLSLLN